MTGAHKCQPDIAGYREAEGHASSLLQQAIWIEDSVDGTGEPSQRLDLGDVDTDELRSAAQYIMQQEAKVDELTKALQNILDENDEFRKGMPADWEGDPLEDACAAARLTLGMPLEDQK